jgi:hypothetical protein
VNFRWAAERRAEGRPEEYRHLDLAARHVVGLGRLVDHLSMVSVMKSPNMMSTIGRMPVAADARVAGLISVTSAGAEPRIRPSST